MNIENLKLKLGEFARRKIKLEGSTPFEISGGNYDDAYYYGFEDGQIELAKEILEEMNKE